MAEGRDTKAELLERSPLLRAADPETQRKLASALAPACRWRSVRRRQPLFVGAEVGPAVLEEGFVRVYALADSRRVVGIRGPDEVVGEEALGARKRRLVAMTPVTMLWVSASVVVAMMAADASLCTALSACLVAGTDEAEQNGARLRAATVEQRLSAFLLGAVRRWGEEREEGQGTRIGAPLTGDEIAQVIRSTRGTVSTMLGAWVRKGLLAKDGRRFVVLDVEQLETLAAAT
jgi:CRP-like cAMP-binding protein